MWLRIIVFLLLLAMIAPILVIIPLSFTSVSYFQLPLPGFSLKWYESFIENSDWITTLLRSLNIAFFTAIIATVIGTMGAYAVVRMNFIGKKIFMALMVTPIIIPMIIVGVIIFKFFSTVQLTNTFVGMVLAHSVLAIPIVFITVTASLKGVDKNLELAAMGLGSTPLGAFFKVTVPLIRPALFSGLLISFITSFDEPVISLFIAGPETKTLPVFMFENIRTQVDPTIAAVSTTIIFFTVIVFLLQEWISVRAEKTKNKSVN